jgi:hypothetical protein
MKSKRISWSKFAAVGDSCPTKRKCIANHKHPNTNYELNEIMRWDEASVWYPRHLLEISAGSCLDVTCTLVFRSMEGGHVTPLQWAPPASCSSSELQWTWLLAAAVSTTPPDFRCRKLRSAGTIRGTDCIITWHSSAFRKQKNLYLVKAHRNPKM